MAILIQQDYAQAGDSLGMRAKVRPQDIKSGTYYGQLQLRGSILVIKDAQDAASGYIAYGTDMTTIPTSSSTGTGVYQDHSGIYGLNGGTKQFYWTSADGKGYAGAGAVTLDEDGITITQGQNDNNIVKWTFNGTSFLGIGGSYAALSRDIGSSSFLLHTAETNSELSARFTVYTGVNEPDLNFYMNVNGSTVVSPTYGAASDAWARLWSADGTFLGLLIGEGNSADDYQPQSLLHLHSTAPTFRMEDTTASAKSLLVTVDTNKATFGEVAGGTFVNLDLANKRTTFGSITDLTNAGRTVNIIDSAAFLRIYRITSDLDAASPTIEMIGAAAVDTASGSWSSRWDMRLNAADSFILRRRTGGDADKFIFTTHGSLVVNSAAIATNATDGFLYVPTCAGTPTGTPTTFTGRAALVFDTTNNKLYVYDGGWVDVT